MSVVEDSDDWRRFLAAMPNEATRKVYALSMKYIFAHCGLDNVAFVRLAKGDPDRPGLPRHATPRRRLLDCKA